MFHPHGQHFGEIAASPGKREHQMGRMARPRKDE
jgi:hypothetical protein